MTVECPDCHKPIEPRDINVGTDVAYCRSCGKAMPLSAIARAGLPALGAPVDLNNPPRGVWIHDDGVEMVIGATTTSSSAVIMLPFTALWLSFTVGSVYVLLGSGAFNLKIVLFYIPFVLVSIILVAICAVTVFGRVEVRLRERDGTIFEGVGRFGRHRRFDAASVVRVYEGDSGWYKGEWASRPIKAIFLDGASRVKFGALLNDTRRYFVIGALQKILTK